MSCQKIVFARDPMCPRLPRETPDVGHPKKAPRLQKAPERPRQSESVLIPVRPLVVQSPDSGTNVRMCGPTDHFQNVY